jgi:predicted RNase H-like nuclease (RuvC/YqgF family)
MRNSTKFALAALFILCVGAGAILFQKYRESSTALASLKTQDDQTREQYASAISSIASIQDSLNSIVLGDQAAHTMVSSYDTEHQMMESRGDRVLARIGVLRAGIERSKARIEELDRNLKKSGMKIDGLEQMIASLKRTVEKKEVMIQQLAVQVDSLHTQVNGLTADNESKRQELSTVFVMIGSKKDLTTAGVVVAKGGVLGIGKTLKPSGNVDESLCTAVDTDQQTAVDIPAKKAQVLSSQAASSYILEPDGDHVVLRILDPKEFRKIRHVVIMKLTA